MLELASNRTFSFKGHTPNFIAWASFMPNKITVCKMDTQTMYPSFEGAQPMTRNKFDCKIVVASKWLMRHRVTMASLERNSWLKYFIVSSSRAKR